MQLCNDRSIGIRAVAINVQHHLDRIGCIMRDAIQADIDQHPELMPGHVPA